MAFKISCSILLVVVGLCILASCRFGSTLYTPATIGSIQCLARQNITFAYVRGNTVDGVLDTNALNTLHTLQDLGIKADVYMLTCRGKDAVAQTNAMMDNLPANLYDKIWVSLLRNPNSGCDWASYSADSNCQFLRELVAAVKNRGKDVGI